MTITEYLDDKGKIYMVGCDTPEEGKAYNSKDKDKLLEEMPPKKRYYRLKSDKNKT